MKKIQMEAIEKIEKQIRRSSFSSDPQGYANYLEYAKRVRDEEQVYNYMEENQIGVDEIQFWIARLVYYKNSGQYKKFQYFLDKIKRNQTLRKHHKYWAISILEKNLQDELNLLIRKKMKKKRTAREQSYFSFSHIEKQTRKFGNIQAYVDPQYRQFFKLDDYIDFIIEHYPEECELTKNIFDRQIAHKPLSFIGRRDAELLSLSKKLIDNPDKQKSEETKERRDAVQTPDFKKNPRKSNCHLQSVEILKKMDFRYKRRSSLNRNIQNEENPEHFLVYQNKQTTRFVLDKVKNSNASFFSFGKKRKEHSLLSRNDEAFLDNSLDNSRDSDCYSVERLSAQLENLIHELNDEKQKENNRIAQTQTFSSIDSDKENNYFEEDLQGFDKNKEEKIIFYQNQENNRDESVKDLFPELFNNEGGSEDKERRRSSKGKIFPKWSDDKNYSSSDSKLNVLNKK